MCANADTTGTLYLQMGVALCMEVEMHDVRMYWSCASEFHALSTFEAHWHNVIGHC